MELKTFYYVASCVYLLGATPLIRELFLFQPRQWREREIIPLLLALTICYITIVAKTTQLATLFVGL